MGTVGFRKIERASVTNIYLGQLKLVATRTRKAAGLHRTKFRQDEKIVRGARSLNTRTHLAIRTLAKAISIIPFQEDNFAPRFLTDRCSIFVPMEHRCNVLINIVLRLTNLSSIQLLLVLLHRMIILYIVFYSIVLLYDNIYDLSSFPRDR